LAALADPRCKSPREVIEKSLVANWDENLLFTLKQSFELYHFIQKQMIQTEKKAEKIILKYKASLPKELVHQTECKRIDKVEAAKNKISIDIVATANKIGKIIYSMVKNQTEYDETLVQEDKTKILKMKLKRTERELENIKKQLSDCA
jgi:hypothetical protein